MPHDPSNRTGGLREAWRGAVTRRIARRGPVPDSFAFKPSPFDVGSPEIAAAMLRGQFSFAGVTARAERGDPWRTDPPSPAWSEALHGFTWLDHFRAADGETARQLARKITDAWLHRFGKSGAVAWRPTVTGDRVVAWCRNADLLVENAEPVYRSDLFRSLAAQTRYLRATAHDESDPAARMRAGLGAVYGALCLETEATSLPKSLDLVLGAVRASSFADGGPKSRAPSDLLHLSMALVQLRADMEAAGEGALGAKLTPSIEAMIPVLRMLRSGDGALSLFHGGRAMSADRVNLALVESHISKPPPDDLAESGYMRLAAGETSILLDAGSTPGGTHARTAHAAPLAVTLSSSRRQLIVSCGSAVHLGGDWETPCRASAAHSTLTVAERSPCSFEGKSGQVARRIRSGAEVIDRRRERDDSGIWALAAHDGYASRYGLIHYRRLFLSADGADFRGEDTLTLAKNGKKTLERSRAARKSPDGPGFAIRFHLHPDVRAEIHEGKAIMTRPTGEVWRLMQSGGTLSIEDSVFLPDATAPQPTHQIVIESALRDTEGQVRWAMRRLATADGSDAAFPFTEES